MKVFKWTPQNLTQQGFVFLYVKIEIVMLLVIGIG